MNKLFSKTIEAAEIQYQRVISFRESHELSYLAIVFLSLVFFSLAIAKILSMIDFWYWSPVIAACLGFSVIWYFLNDSSLDWNNLSSQFGGKNDQINGARALALVFMLFVFSYIIYFSYFGDLTHWIIRVY